MRQAIVRCCIALSARSATACEPGARAPSNAASDGVEIGADAPTEVATDARDPPDATDPTCAVPPGAGPRIRAAVPALGLRCTRYPFPLAAPRDAVETRDGEIYVTEMAAGRVVRLTPGGLVPVASGLSQPIGIREGRDGALYVAEEGRQSLTRIDRRSGAHEVVASGLGNVTYLTLGGDDAAYVSSFTAFAPNGTIQRVDLLASLERPEVREYASGLNVPEGLVFDATGGLIVAEWNTPSRVMRLPVQGGPVARGTLVVGGLQHAYGVARAHPSGFYVADTASDADRVVRVGPDGAVDTVLTHVASPAGLNLTANGDLLVVEHVDSDGHNATGYLIRVSGLPMTP